MRLVAILALLACAAAPRTAAQTPSYDESLRALAAIELAGRTPAVQAHTPAPPADLFEQRRRRARRAPGTVFLIVGGAVAVAGILADEDILIIGGVVVAGYGLYLNVR
jgi:hypothetical protein